LSKGIRICWRTNSKWQHNCSMVPMLKFRDNKNLDNQHPKFKCTSLALLCARTPLGSLWQVSMWHVLTTFEWQSNYLVWPWNVLKLAHIALWPSMSVYSPPPTTMTNRNRIVVVIVFKIMLLVITNTEEHQSKLTKWAIIIVEPIFLMVFHSPKNCQIDSCNNYSLPKNCWTNYLSYSWTPNNCCFTFNFFYKRWNWN
jgi:hypothetical protein